MSKEKLHKSVDEIIDELFAEKPVEKSLEIAQMAKTTADAAVNQAPKAQNDDARGAGRPKQISDVPDNDEDGKRDGQYDASITEKAKEQDQPEASQVKMGGQDKGEQKKDTGPMMKSLSEAEYAEFQAFKKAQADKQKEETLMKARNEQRDLIKSAIQEATTVISKDNEELRKSLKETQELVKSMAERPQRRKSIDGIHSLEKSVRDEEKEDSTFTKSEMLDVAEELVMKKSVDFRDEHLIELENTGFIYDPTARKTLENALKNKK
jgi:hypothetical protein